MDTLVSKPSGKNFSWDFNSKGNTVWGTLEVSFKIINDIGKIFINKYEVCSYSCTQLEQEGVEIDFAKCRFEDQADPIAGFIRPTAELYCD